MINQPYTGFIRVPYEPPCRLVGAPGTCEGRLCNISVRGLYVTVLPIPGVGEVYEVYFSLPDDEEPLRTRVQVAWRNSEHDRKVLRLPLGCGLEFLGLSPSDYDRISAFVNTRSMD